MGAAGLVGDGKVGHVAGLVVSVRAGRVGNVVQDVVLADPGVSGAAGDKVHRVGCREGEAARGLVDEVRTLGHGNVLVGGGDTTAGGGVRGGGLSSVEVVPGIVGDVVGTTRLVNLQEVDGSSVGADLDTDVVAAGERRPVGDAVGVDLAA